jgi:hypothetical protein
LARNSGENVRLGRLIELLLGAQRLNDQPPIIHYRPVSKKTIRLYPHEFKLRSVIQRGLRLAFGRDGFSEFPLFRKIQKIIHHLDLLLKIIL